MSRLRKWLLPCILVLALPVANLAQQKEDIAKSSPVASEVQLTQEVVQKRLQELEKAADLDERAKAKLRVVYQDALRELRAADASQTAAAQFAHEAVHVKDTLRQALRERDSLLRTPKVRLGKTDSLADIQAQLTQALEKLGQAETALNTLQQEPNRRAERIKAIPVELQALKDKLTAVKKQLGTPPKLGQAAMAQQTYWTAAKLALEKKMDELRKERDAYAATVDLLPVQRALAAARVTLAEREVELLRQHVSESRRREVDQQVNAATQFLAQVPGDLKPLARENLRLAKQRKQIRADLDTVSTDLEKTKKVLDTIQKRRRRLEGKVTAVGLTDGMGQLLLAERAALPDVNEYRRHGRKWATRLRELRLKQFKLEEDRAKLDDLGELAEAFANTEKARKVLETQREYLDLLIADSSRFLYALVELDSTERKLVEEVKDFVLYVNKHILWISSASPLSLRDIKPASLALQWLLNPKEWQGVGQALLEDSWHYWPSYSAVGLVAVVLLFLSPYLRRLLLDIGEQVQKRGYAHFWPTVHALFLTVLVAIVLPLPMWLIGWRLSLSQENTTLARALGGGLMHAARVFLLLMLIRHVCRAKGLAGAHFGWTDTDLGKLRKYVRWLALTVVPLTFCAALMQSQPNPQWRNSLSRVCFVVAMAILTVFAHRLLRPKVGLLYQLSVARNAEWLARFRYIWYLLGVGSLLMVGMLAVFGYYYTAWQLVLRMEASVWLLFGALLAGSILLRWILIARRWLAMYQVRRHHEQVQTEALPDGANDRPTTAVQPDVDLSQVNLQTRRLLLTGVAVFTLVGLGLIWTDVFPALTYLDQLPLWSKTVSTQISDATAGSRMVEQVEPVSLYDLLMGVLISAVAVVVVRNVPGLFQLLMLERLPLDASLRLTIITITRYLLVVLAVLFVSERVGLAWSSVQWLVAALMIGLGFGLQEIFANFISGLILLIERPIRVGDLVTVDKINGEVSQINMRATIIRDWNKRELIVPNKRLITGQLINWTLTDSIYRVDLKFGIAYGSDTELARQILLQIADEHPNVLPKPTPKAIFKKFGDSALLFEFRICIPHMDYWPRVITQINQAIADKFKEAGLVIAFPQHDIHIRTIGDDDTEEDGVLRRMLTATLEGGGQQST